MIQMLAMLLANLLLQHASASSSVDLQPVSSTSSTVDLQPHSKWIRCIDDGRLDIRWTVHGSGKLHSGVQLPHQAEACKPTKPSSCKWLASCDAATDCSKFFPGELSGRKKCVVVFNAGSDSKQASIQIDLTTAGNWPAIIFGVVITSLGLLGVMAAGCYSDLKALVHGDKGRKRKGAASSQHSTKAAAAGNGHVAS